MKKEKEALDVATVSVAVVVAAVVLSLLFVIIISKEFNFLTCQSSSIILVII